MITSLLLGFLLMLTSSAYTQAAENMDLSGNWQFALDADAVGVEQQWFSNPLPDSLSLPGSCQEQGFGEVPTIDSKWTVNGSYQSKIDRLPHFKPYLEKDGKFRHPFWWTPDRLYVGPAWYQKEVVIPEHWQGMRITLHLERVHWESTLWVDDSEVGLQNGLGVPHIYDLSPFLTPGTHRLTLCVDNRIKDIDVGSGGHSISDHTQGNWNGIVGKLELTAVAPVSIEHIRVDATDHQTKIAHVRFTVRNLTDQPANIGIAYDAATTYGPAYAAPKGSVQASIPAHTTQTVATDYPLGKEAPLWNEFDPAIFTLHASVMGGNAPGITQTTFGIRRIETNGNHILVNGRKIFLRGTLDCCIFPDTGYPPTDKASWRRIFTIVKQHGLNHVRYHSWTPPKAAYEAADELGIYLQPEFLMWVKFGHGTSLDPWILDEARRLFKHYGNHPSFALMAIGNECTNGGMAYMDRTINTFKTEDGRRLYTDNVSRSWSEFCDFTVRGVKFSDRKTSGVSAQDTDFDRSDYFKAASRPEITHEDGQWSTWPNMATEHKYTGSLHPYYLEVYRDLMKQAGVWDRYQDYYMASGKLQVSLYKATVETALKTPDQAGVQLLDLRDFPGQGYAPIGVLDPFWDPKGYSTPRDYRTFCNQTVPLARFTSYVWTTDQAFTARVEIAHYGPANLTAQPVTWILSTADGKTLGEGTWAVDLKTGTVTGVGTIEVPLADCREATQAKLEIRLPGTEFMNQWPVWIYPAEAKPEPASVLVAEVIDDTVRSTLSRGGSVLLAPPPQMIRGDTYGAYASIYWTRVMFMSARVHTLGAYCDADHPALAQFPTESFTDWQWYDLMERSKPILMAHFPSDIRPVVEPIDDWNHPRPLGLIFEAKVGAGRLLCCGMDIARDLESRPAARQLRHSLLAYMNSKEFNPTSRATVEMFEAMLLKISANVITGSSASDSAAGYELINALDENPETFWHSPWDASGKMPQHVTIDLGESRVFKGVNYLPRQEGNDRTRVKTYELLISDNAENWHVVKEGTVPNRADWQELQIDAPLMARFVRFRMLEAYGEPCVSIAEINVIAE